MMDFRKGRANHRRDIRSPYFFDGSTIARRRKHGCTFNWLLWSAHLFSTNFTLLPTSLGRLGGNRVISSGGGAESKGAVDVQRKLSIGNDARNVL